MLPLLCGRHAVPYPTKDGIADGAFEAVRIMVELSERTLRPS